jgi:hypothetical protein
LSCATSLVKPRPCNSLTRFFCSWYGHVAWRCRVALCHLQPGFRECQAHITGALADARWGERGLSGHCIRRQWSVVSRPCSASGTENGTLKTEHSGRKRISKEPIQPPSSYTRVVEM